LDQFTDAVPTDGVFAASYYPCAECDDTPPEVTVTDAAGQEVAGTIIDTHAQAGKSFAWKPKALLVKGETYKVTLGAPFEPDLDQTDLKFSVEAPEPTLILSVGPDVDLSPRYKTKGEQVCCETEDSCGAGTSCFTAVTEVEAEVFAFAHWSSNAYNSVSQFVYSVTFTAGKYEATTDWASESYGSATLPEADSYCYEVRGRNIATEREIDVGRDCIDGNKVELADDATWIENDLEQQLDWCLTPPPGFEERWCELNAQWRLACDDSATNCAAAHEACPADAEDAPDAGPSLASEDQGEGCSIGSVGTPSSLSLAWAGLGLAVIALRRRRA
jgi:MYXO-CTERM domain-containing protein